MPTTQVTEITSSIDAIAARTNSAGGAVSPDWAAEERRMDHELSNEGVVKPVDAYQVVAGAAATMNIVVGSGTAKTDLALVQGDIGGQGKYLVRFDEVTKTIALDAADPSDPRIDEVYLVVYDNIYDATSRSLPRFAVRKGDAAASPSLPGPDAAWEAFLLLSEITIPAAAADILAATFVDKRVFGGVVPNQGYFPDPDHVIFTADGSFVKANYSGLRAIKVKMVGGGGGGGGSTVTTAGEVSCGGGGGGGAYAESFILASALAASETVQVGVAGLGVDGANGTNGEDSEFGSAPLVRADAGKLGNQIAAQSAPFSGGAGGAGGLVSGSIGDLRIAGGRGSGGAGPHVNLVRHGGGGSSQFGYGWPELWRSGGGTGGNAELYGAGGSGSARGENISGNLIGGDGSDGIVIVELYF